ncbi:hypothetical protein Tco_0525532 [Tanacetum coccineum]
MFTGRTTLTFEDVLKALRDNERMTGNDSSSSSDKLLLADDSGRGRNFQCVSSKDRSKSRIGGDRDISVVECYYCGDKGHMQLYNVDEEFAYDGKLQWTEVFERVKTKVGCLVRRCGGSSGGWSGGDGDDMVSVDGDSGGMRGGVEVAGGGEWGSRSSRSKEDLHVYRFLCSPEFGRKRWPAADRWSPEK